MLLWYVQCLDTTNGVYIKVSGDKYLTVNRKGTGMKMVTSMIIILLFTIVNIRLAESRIFMTPNAWLTIEEDSKDKIENLKLVDTSSVHNKEVPTKKNSVEPVQEPEHDATPFPKGKSTASM